MTQVSELRLVVTVDDFEQAVTFYRDVLGMTEQPGVVSPGGRVAILAAGMATLELADPAHADGIDAIEVGERIAGKYRVALRVDDVERSATTAARQGATMIAAPTATPWGSRNARLAAPGGVQLTLFGA